MQKLKPTDLMPLEQYARERAAIRARMIAYRSTRRLALGAHCTLSFEDRETIRYQVQEMLRAEKVFEAAGIAEELDSYNPLIPDGSNLKATMLIEYDDATERALRLRELRGVERQCWLQVAGHERVIAIADEDMPRENDEKTSAVHFLRFEFTPAMLLALRAGAALSAGTAHPAYTHVVAPLPAALRDNLVADLS
jgi:hypothetical protein